MSATASTRRPASRPRAPAWPRSPRPSTSSRAPSSRAPASGSSSRSAAVRPYPTALVSSPNRRRRRPQASIPFGDRLGIQAPVPFDLIQDLAVLDLPGGRALLEVLDAAADFLVELVVDLHVLLEDVGHALAHG